MARTVDPDAAFKSIYNMLRKPENLTALRVVQSRNEPAMKQILRMFGLDPNDPHNIEDLFNQGQLFSTEADDEAQQQQAEAKAQQDKDKVRQEYGDAVKSIMMTDPTTRAMYTAVDLVGEGLHAAGDNSENNGNRMAAALLAARREHSDKQDEIYGKNKLDKTTEATAQDTIRQGENTGRFLHGLGNVINRFLGQKVQEDATIRQMQMLPYDRELNMPGNYYQAMSQDRKRMYNNYNK